jgi:quercetin dioxygenase-like cupin family protein
VEPQRVPAIHALERFEIISSCAVNSAPHNVTAVGHHSIGDLAEVLDNLGVFRAAPEDLVELCPSGFRRVPISTGADYYLSIQGFAPEQIAYAHTHPDSEEWVMVLGGRGEARFGTQEPLGLRPGMVVGRAERHPHGFLSGSRPMYLLSIQLPRPAEGSTTWDEPGTTTEPVPCQGLGGPCRRCPRCGGHSARGPTSAFRCENCGNLF